MAILKITQKHNKRFNNPFPSAPRTVPIVQGSLFVNSKTVASHKIFALGNDFQLSWSSNNGGHLSISHLSQPSRPIWSSIPGQAFVSAALADTEVEESRGSFLVKDRDVHLVCNNQTIDDIKVINRCDHHLDSELGLNQKSYVKDSQLPTLLITGRLFNTTKKNRRFQKQVKHGDTQFKAKGPSAYARYWVLFNQKTNSQVGFQVKIEKPNFISRKQLTPKASGIYRGFKKRVIKRKNTRLGWCWNLLKPRGFVLLSSAKEEMGKLKMPESAEFNRIWLTYVSDEDERFYGFGEQFSHMNLKGKRVPIFVQEQGIGRGDQPITFAANLVSYRAGGDWSTTYAPSPFYMTSKMRSVYLEGYDYSVFDLTRPDRVQIQIHGNSVEGRILHGNSPCELIEHFTETIGRQPELPEWIISGAIVGMQGGTDTVRHIWDELRAYDVPISAFWLQDWVGQRETVIGSQLWWNWEVDALRYRGWKELIKDLSAHHIKVMTYCNPCLAPVDEKPNIRRNHFEEAKQLDILVKDKNGDPYMVPNTAFNVGMLDLTHPKTATWFKQVLREMVDDGVRGWMADFGEGLPVDAILYSGEDPISAHNRYPELWAQVNREFVEEWKSNSLEKLKEDQEEGMVFFMRAGFRNSPRWGMLFWEGDQMVSWQVNDGIKSSVVGLLSSGISGFAFNHSDIGGYCTVNMPIIKYRRCEELLLRWMELNSFTTVFRTHEGNKPSCNSQFYSNQQTLSHFARFAKVYTAWKFYRIQLVKEAAQKGLPVCRHLFLHYPNDEYVVQLSYQQFLVGSEILVVPVLDKGKKKVRAYFPVGESSGWVHIWTGEVFSTQGSEAWIEAPIGYPAVFIKVGSIIGETFLQNLRSLGIL
ncbi:Alpha-glucosidase yihQ [Senna tora]|uniref:Alpha-glucosidase yihQ n=1 Tax=Senna tora TaxID=362788 RepID=A0A834TCZ4_9FABA|nr:Alpha-glucosidase yihQ [Senna tora]